MLCLVSGGADSTCLVLALRELGYRASALHVAHGLRGAESDADARFCVEALGAEVVDAPGSGLSEAELRDLRYAQAPDRLRATGHTASDQVETILYRLVSSGTTTGIKPRREDGVVRPLLPVWREETEAFCRERGVEFRVDSSNAATKRGLIRGEILPLLEQLHPAARENILRSLETRRTMPPALAELLDTPCRVAPGRSGRRAPGGARARPPLARAWAGGADHRGRVGRVAHPFRAPRPYGSGVATRRSPRRALQEDPGRVRRRQDPALRP